MPDAFYVYAITSPHAALPVALCGIDDVPVTLLDSGDLAAVVSGNHARTLQPAARHVLRHEQVVEAVRRVAPALPVRFGTLLPTPQAVTTLLTTHVATLRDDLQRIGRAVEMGVTIVAELPPGDDEGVTTDASGPGGRYMQERLKAYHRTERARGQAEALGEQVRMVLAPMAREVRLDILPRERIPLRVSCLLDPETVAEFQRVVERLRARSDLGHILLSGPWPPYSFVTPLHPDRHAVVAGLLQQMEGRLPLGEW
jgi:hypothetical protein